MWQKLDALGKKKKALATKQALEAEAARTTDPAQKAALLARAQAAWDDVEKQCELEAESVHEQIATARSLRATRGLAGLQNLARNLEARQDDEMRDMKHKLELERLRHELEVQRLKSDARNSEVRADYERQLRIMTQEQADKHHAAVRSEAGKWQSLAQARETRLTGPANERSSNGPSPTKPESRTELHLAAFQAVEEAQRRFNRISTNAQQTNDATLRDLPGEPRNHGDQATFEAYTARQIYAQAEFAALARDLAEVADAVGSLSCSDDDLATVPARVKALIDDCLRRWIKFCDEVAAVAWVILG
ncbi:hypothetical protein MMC27_007721 [Xylographa pallens]|nr:hypothetical protein [Xylographa pallens]